MLTRLVEIEVEVLIVEVIVSVYLSMDKNRNCTKHRRSVKIIGVTIGKSKYQKLTM